MRWLSQGAEVLTAEIRAARSDRVRFDVVVIGSGYGGAVAALRLAEAGRSVCVLERGDEWVPGDFPNDMSELPGHLRIERGDRMGVIGRRNGIFDVRLFGKVTVLTGNALGGGSQINANVALRADPDVFRHTSWPEALRSQYDPLDAYYTRVESMLGAAPYPHRSRKADQLKRLAAPLTKHVRRRYWTGDEPPEATWYKVPLAITYRTGPNAVGVQQQACTGCGDCVTGCNVGAKNTLTMNYLPAAYAAGARIFTGATVIAIEPFREEKKQERHAAVYFVHSDEDWSKELAETRRLKEIDFNNTKGVFAIDAKVVVLAAGTLGSTEILLRSRQLDRMSVSPQLGKAFSGNGGALAFGVDQRERVGAIGGGSEPRPAERGTPHSDAPGPTIVSTLDIRPGLPTRDGLLIQDGIIPGALKQSAHEMLTLASNFELLATAWALRRDGPGSDPLALNVDLLEHTQVYLGIGHDEGSGRMQLRDGRVVVDWPEGARQAGAKRADEYLHLTEDELGAIYLTSPLRQPFPKALSDTLAGPPIEGTAMIVHPLGGCAMGEDFQHAVVDHTGAVYSGETPRSTHGNVFVWDGSILPGSVGANPFLTIAALAERAASLLIASPEFADMRWTPPLVPCVVPALPLHERRAAAPVPTALVLKETLRGCLRWTKGEHAGHTTGAVLRIATRIPDLDTFLRGPLHRVRTLEPERTPGATMTGELAWDPPDPAAGAERPRREITGGSIEFFAREPSNRLQRTWRAGRAWWAKRGRDEICRYFRERVAGKRSTRNLLEYVIGLLRMANHAGERRMLEYRIDLGEGNDALKLVGDKTVEFAVGSNIWERLLRLEVKLLDASGAEVATGRLELDLIDLADDDFPQIDGDRPLPGALVSVAGLGLLFLRVIVKTHLWDLRAPDYLSRALRSPLPDQRPLLVERLKGHPGLVPTYHWFKVEAGLPDDEDPDLTARQPPLAAIPLVLTRFAPPKEIAGAHRTPIMLLHGFAQSSRAFAAEQLEEDLPSHLVRLGYDVWLLDYRTSTALPSGRKQYTLDQVAKYDLPRAVDEILKLLPGSRQILAFGHCMGAATLAMSLLGGYLKHKDGSSKLRALVLSQVPPYIVGGRYSQYRRQLAAFLRDVLGVGHVNLAADDGATGWEVLVDRLFATLPGEACPQEHDRVEPRTDIATCKRVQGIIGPLYVHENVKASHPVMHQYFGWGSISVFAQIAKFFEYERLVSAEGANHYVTDDNIYAHMGMPVAFLHGTRNLVFDPESAERSCRQFKRVTGRSKDYEVLWADGYAHFDCLVGNHAHTGVFPKVTNWLDHYVDRGAAPLLPPPGGPDVLAPIAPPGEEELA